MEHGGAVGEGTREARERVEPAPPTSDTAADPVAPAEHPPRTPRVLLCGAGGNLGRALLGELLRETGAQVVLAGRRARRLSSAARGAGRDQELRLERLELDLWEQAAVARAVEGIDVAVCAAGPAHEVPTTMARECMRVGVPYLDLADDSAFVARVRELAADPYLNPDETPVATGWGTLGALAAVLARIGREDLDAVDSISVCLAPERAQALSKARIAALTHAVSRPFKVLRQGLWSTVEAWSEPAEFKFPAPIGALGGRLVDAPALALLAEHSGARRVEVRLACGSGLVESVLNGVAAGARRGWVEEGSLWSGPLRAGLGLANAFGGRGGGLGVEVEGRYGRRPLTRRVSIVAVEHADRMAVLAASVMARRMLEDQASLRGSLGHDDWIDAGSLRTECERLGLQLVVEEE